MGVKDWVALVALGVSLTGVLIGFLVSLQVRLTKIEITQNRACRALRRIGRRVRELGEHPVLAADGAGCAGRAAIDRGPPPGGGGARG